MGRVNWAVGQYRPGETAEDLYMRRDDATELLLEAKHDRGLSFTAVAAAVGRHRVWVTAAMLGQASMDEAEAEALLEVLGMGGDSGLKAALLECPMKGALDSAVPVDPLIYRLHEISQVYGTTIKALIHEEFGDGIMSAIDLEIDIERMADPKGDRVKITYNGKFLPYRKW